MDRELDRRVAEQVMGFRVVTPDVELDDVSDQICILQPSFVGLERYYEQSANMWGLKPWHPSEDIAAAWDVVERMRDLGWWLKASAYFMPHTGCSAGFTPTATTGWNGRPDYDANAPTMPEAVCRAALAVVEDTTREYPVDAP